MALRRSVMKEDYILCELYENTLSNVSDNGENEILTVTSPLLVHINNCDLL
jgi:hypothetical protein